MRWLAGAAVGVVITMGAAAAPARADQPQIPTVTTYTGTDENFPNPERGFSQAGTSAISQNQFNNWRNQGYTLVRYQVDLRNFRTQPLSTTLLNQINTDFTRARTAGIKLIPRFAYDYTAGGQDAPVDLVVSQIKQLAPVLAANEDVISYVEAGFIGAWGEWHASSHNLIYDFETGNNFDHEINDATRAIYTALLAAVPRSRMIDVRTQRYKIQLFGNSNPLTPSEAFSGSDRARTGVHNDCFLANVDDWGTYGPDPDADKAWLSIDSRYTPSGGETCAADDAAAPYIACPAAVHTMEQLHWTNLNIGWNPAVYAVWTQQGCMPQVRIRFGYRFRLVDLTVATPKVYPGSTLKMTARIANDGFATPFNQHPVKVVLRNADTGATYELPTTADPRWWTAGQVTTVPLDVDVPTTVPKGRYRLLLHFPDASPSLAARPQYAIRLANTGTWDATTALNDLLTDVSVDPSVSSDGGAGGSVPATLSLTLGTPAAFGAFTPGVGRDYDATTTAGVISTAGNAQLSVADPSATATGHLVNGAFSLPSAVQASATSPAGTGGALADVGGSASPTALLTYAGPVANDPVALAFRQHVGASDALRTGAYSKTLTFTLSTTSP